MRQRSWISENIKEQTPFSDEVIASAEDSPWEPDVHTMSRYVNSVRNQNAMPVSAPFLYGAALKEALGQLKNGEGPLSMRISVPVLKMVREIAGLLEPHDESPEDRDPRVVFARVESDEEGMELAAAMRVCMREFSSVRSRGRGYGIDGCRFFDQPILALPERARGAIAGVIPKGGPLSGKCCRRCSEIFSREGGSTRVRGFDVSERHSYVGRGVSDVDGLLADSARGMVEIWDIRSVSGHAALRSVAGSSSVRIDGEVVSLDVLALCPLAWGEPVPEWTLDRALVVDSVRADGGEVAVAAVGYRIRHVAARSSLHVAPHVPFLAAGFARAGKVGYSRNGESLGRLDMEAAGKSGCVSHENAVLSYFRGDDAPDSREMEAKLSALVERDVLMAWKSETDSCYERLASAELVGKYLRPLAFVLQNEDAAEETADMKMVMDFEKSMQTLKLVGKKDEDVAELRTQVKDEYARELHVLLYAGGESVDGERLSAELDVETLRYDRHGNVGAALDSKMLGSVGELRKKAAASPELREDVAGLLSIHYGYCAVCARVAVAEVVPKPALPWRRWFVRDDRE